MKVSRRDFLKISAGAGAAATFMNKNVLEQAMAIITQNNHRRNLVWIKAQGCEGCTISALQWCGEFQSSGSGYQLSGSYQSNLFRVIGDEKVSNVTDTDLEFHPTLMPQSGCYVSTDGEDYDPYTGYSDWGYGLTSGEPEDETYVDAMQWLENVVSETETYVVVEGSIPYEYWGDNEEMGFCVLGMYDKGGGTYKEGDMWEVSDIIKWLHEKTNVKAFIALGNCSSFGGVPGGQPNPTGAKGLQHYLEDAATSKQFNWLRSITSPGYSSGYEPRAPSGLHKPVINIDGCPAHPEHLVLVYAALIAGDFDPSDGLPRLITLDQWNRPETVTVGTSTVTLFDKQVHDECERIIAFENGEFATSFIEAIESLDPNSTYYDSKAPQGKCLLRLGCRGPNTFNNCSFGGTAPSNSWNPYEAGNWNKDRDNPMSGDAEVYDGSWCVAVGAPCNGCSTTTFPDNVLGRGFFKECKHSEWLAAGKIPGDASGATPDYEGSGVACYTCHAVNMPRKDKEWIGFTDTGYGSENDK